MIDTYTVQQIKLAAYNQIDAPQNMNMAEQLLFWKLFDVYRRFRSGDISKSEGERQFRDLSREFEQNAGKLDMAERIIQNHAMLWKGIETAASDYCLSGNRTKEADAFVEAVYGVQLKPRGVDQNDNIEDP